MEQNSSADVQSQNGENSPAVSPHNETSTASVTERMIPESEVNNRIRHATANVAEKVRRELGSSQNQPSQMQQPQKTNSIASNGLTEEQIRKIAAETVQKEQQELIRKAHEEAQMQVGYRIANEFKSKLEAGRSSYSDFDEVVGDLRLGEMPHVIELANKMENTADIMYELGNNPHKISKIMEAFNFSTYAKAEKEMRKLSESIKLNQQAKHVKQANEPLSRLQPSPIDVDSGQRTVKDFRKIFRA